MDNSIRLLKPEDNLLWCDDCNRYQLFTVYNDKVIPVMYTCKKCGQFIYGIPMTHKEILEDGMKGLPEDLKKRIVDLDNWVP